VPNLVLLSQSAQFGQILGLSKLAAPLCRPILRLNIDT